MANSQNSMRAVLPSVSSPMQASSSIGGKKYRQMVETRLSGNTNRLSSS